jgi:hypothetical protein
MKYQRQQSDEEIANYLDLGIGAADFYEAFALAPVFRALHPRNLPAPNPDCDASGESFEAGQSPAFRFSPRS